MNNYEKVRKSWETYQNTINSWVESGKYESWQFGDNLITDFQTYLVGYNNERNKLRTRAKATKKSYLKKENITRRLLNQTVVYKAPTLRSIAKITEKTVPEIKSLIKSGNLMGSDIWAQLMAATDGDYDEASYWYSTFIPTDTIRTKRGKDKELTVGEAIDVIFGDSNGKKTE